MSCVFVSGSFAGIAGLSDEDSQFVMDTIDFLVKNPTAMISEDDARRFLRLKPTECLPGDLCETASFGLVRRGCKPGYYQRTAYDGTMGVMLCLPCMVGYQCGGNAPYDCPFGSYSDETGLTQCKLCPNGTTTFARGAASVDDCVACYNNAGVESWKTPTYVDESSGVRNIWFFVKDKCVINTCQDGYSRQGAMCAKNGTNISYDRDIMQACWICAVQDPVDIHYGEYGLLEDCLVRMTLGVLNTDTVDNWCRGGFVDK